MKKITILVIVFLFTGTIYGQATDSGLNLNNNCSSSGLTTLNQNPLVIVEVDSKMTKLNNFDNYNIKPKWIKSVSVLKDDMSKKIYGNKNGVIIIYTKDKYRKRVLREIRSKGVS